MLWYVFEEDEESPVAEFETLDEAQEFCFVQNGFLLLDFWVEEDENTFSQDGWFIVYE